MSTNSSDLERPRNPTHFGGEGLYDASSVEDAGPLKAPIGDLLDSSTRQALLSDRSAQPWRSFVKRYPLGTAAAIGAVGFLLAALARRSLQR